MSFATYCPFLMLPSLTLVATTVQAQVANDDIEQRRVLRTNETVRSNTTNCTVQWSCVDEKLTGKCIEYHNDQWFEFTPRVSGRYFVNIGGQSCRDTRGVQLVVLTGTPCQPSTYQVLSCTSLGSQDDVFITLDSLRAGKPYLLDVDGYLKDFCEFTLTVSDRARGVPATVPPVLSSVAPSSSRVVMLRWTLPDSLEQVRQFRILRREAAAFRASEQATVSINRTTYGANAPDYTWTDTLLTPGRYLYQVVAESPNTTEPVILHQQWYAYTQPMPKAKLSTRLNQRAEAQATHAQQSWERRSHRARLKRLRSRSRN
ncbi:hypothetical protein [Hymenobacter sp. GOD-10R]|uniref:hypothetical protein n=1 Tax=Hymenobacter sp. GOD-10R TaxID=3093922 RepID=UPI002D79CC29|nr:hypothetical protein [Hymenobacter sp. GOD-10R]WRQ28068.1 hypothetical protein SD425_23635 [Hymenobacter sp. GOD-10R]